MQKRRDSAIEAVLWDIDDVLVDTTTMYRLSRQCAFRALGVDAESDPQLFAIWDRLFWFFDQDDTEGILHTVLMEAGLVHVFDHSHLQQAIEAYDAIWNDGIMPVEGVVDIVRSLNDIAVPQAVVSNGSVEYQMRKLEAIGLSSVFEPDRVLIAAKSSPMAKPRPHGIRHMCQYLQVPPSNAAYIGDRHSDMMAANLAGAVGILFGRTPPPPEVLRPPTTGALELEQPQHLVESVVELAELLETAIGSSGR